MKCKEIFCDWEGKITLTSIKKNYMIPPSVYGMSELRKQVKLFGEIEPDGINL